MQTVNNSLAKTNGDGEKRIKFSAAIQSSTYQKLLRSAIADDKRRNRFVTAVVSAVSVNPTLQKCDVDTVISAALQGEALELSPSPALGEYAIVPYGKNWNSSKGDYDSYTAQFQIMTNGRVQLAMRTGVYAKITKMEVREGEYKGRDPETGEPILSFISDDEERLGKPVIGYYAYFKLLNGFSQAVYKSKLAVIEHARRYSKAFDYDLYKQIDEGADISKLPWKMQKKAETPWIQHFDEMAKNYVLREVLKCAPKSIEMRMAEEAEDKSLNDINLADMTTPALPTPEAAEAEFFDDTNDIITDDAAEAEEKPEAKPAKAARAKKAAPPKESDDVDGFFDEVE